MNADKVQVALDAKKDYSKPEIVYKQPLEAMAAACTPVPPGKASTGAPTNCMNLSS